MYFDVCAENNVIFIQSAEVRLWFGCYCCCWW